MKLTTSIAAAAIAAALAACSSSGQKQTVEVQDSSSSGQTLARTMASSGRFEVLSSAFVGAGMAADLDAEGPFTVFVVSDDTLQQVDIDAIAESGGMGDLDSMARFHVVPGIYAAGDLAEEATVTTLTGQRLRLSNWNGMVEVQTFGADAYGLPPARVIEADLFCDNGVIHVIDQPLVPSFESLADHLEGAGVFSRMLVAAQTSGVFELFNEEGPFTVLAPTDAAFDKLPRRELTRLMEDRDALIGILQNHVVRGRIYADTLHHGPLETLAGNRIEISWNRGRAFIG
ncbi:MAG: fasciclin domain-containing protein, partial [Planctomycetota bacterium]